MKASEVKLTKTVIDAAEPREQRYSLWDSELKGFGVRIGVGGVKTFVAKYLAEGGGRRAPQRFYSIGRVGALTVEQARRRAKEIIGAAANGQDPALDRNGKRQERTVAELIDLYESEGCYIQRGKRQGEPMKPLTKKYTMARLRHHVVPLLGRKRVTEIGAAEIERFFRDVENGKTVKNEKTGPRTRIIVKGGSGAARKVFRDFSAVLSFAKRFSLIESNPCEKAVVKKTDNARTRFLSLDELRRFGAACDALEKEGANPKALNIARLWALTGCRRQEIVELKWAEVDFDSGLITLDDTKTGQSTRPLPIAAIALLRNLERVDGTDYVFPADTGESFFQCAATTTMAG
ncbi:tyrosine-type recombinase/integrase [Novosphingobium album (ex Liu et al. 2023)]|uniref:Integrase family protein n=1 Tax=Novosphingobium album (ex Liu et al. 2023) TaxID=3031130 RepID=A0ABT5WQ96_9SPHN|nr:integrase family protein [Novosphingobium album (ex Liu et al. 2023)]MDE8652208.1 integrase family protein [Novosphingobium album (ex Liu et al. 2023)]